ncbi:T9SS type A sorting domain-containing protein [Parasediminibacterium sp. JCM 36343]|uniref:T9SS type A sorting domain-containing protein n=1 Tax=Parasediminibacterium sp. JCM 36343 TaxID=3374279 RepID=UPI00397C5A80
MKMMPLPTMEQATCPNKKASIKLSFLAKLVFFFLLTYSFNSAFAANTYTWIGSSGTVSNPSGGLYTTAGNWSVSRGTPAATDILVINPSSAITITGVPSETIDQLQIGGNNKVTLVPTASSNALTLNTSMTIGSGSTLDVGAIKIVQGTSFTPFGSGALLTQCTSTTPLPTGKTWTFDITYNGTAAQTIVNGTYNTKLVINNTAGTASTLKSSATVTGVLTLTSGVITLGTNNLTISASGSVSGGSSSSYADASSTGRFIKNSLSTTAVLFPIGTSTSYAPLSIKNTGGNSNISAGVQSAITNAPFNSAGVFNLQWSVLGGTATTSNITFQFNGADFPSSYTQAAAELGNYYQTNTYYTATQLGTPAGSNPYTLSATGLNVTTSGTNYYVVGNSGAVVASSITYTWIGGTSGSYATPANWSPTRNVPATGDVLQINQSSPTTISNVPTESITTLSIGGSSTVTLVPATTGNTLTIGTSLAVNPTNTLDLGTIQLAGSFVNSGTGTVLIGNTTSTPVPASKTWTSIVSYDGSSSQTVSGGSYNGGLTISNSAGCSLGGSVSIGSGVSLTLTNGVLTLGAYNLTLGSTSTLSGGSSSSYVNASSTGRYIKNNVSTSSFVTFPVGTATSYAPLTIKNGTSNVAMTVGVQSTLTNAPYNSAGVFNLQWSVLGSAATSAAITFQANGSDFPSTYTPAAAEVGNYQSFYIASQVGTPTGSNPYIFSATTLNVPSSGTNLYVVGNSGAVVASSITYTWIGGTSGSYATPANWSPTRNTPATGDILQINPSSPTTVTNVPTESITTLSIGGSSTVTLSPATAGNILTIGSSLAISNTLDLGTIALAGNFTNSGTGTLLVGNTSSTPIPTGKTWTSIVSYDGSSSQTVSNGSYNLGLTINNAAGCSLGGSVSIGSSASLTLTNGVLALGAYNLTLGSTSTLSGGSSSSYVNASSTGRYIKNNVSTSSFVTFPVGTATSYAPLSIKNSASSINMTVGVQSTLTNAPYNSAGVFNLQWSVLASSTATSTITFQANGSDYPGGTYTPAAAELGNYQTYYFATQLGTPSGSNPYTLTATLSVPSSGTNYYVVGNSGAVVASSITYTWSGGTSGSYTTASNWTPARNTPATGDVLQINPSSPTTITNVPSETITSLSIGGSSTTTLTPATTGNTLTIGSTLVVSTGNALDLGTIALTGSFVNSGTGTLLIGNTSATPVPASKTWASVISYDGSSSQTVSNGSYNGGLIINNAGCTLGGSVSIGSGVSLTLTSGVLALGTNNLTLGSTSTLTGGSSSSYVNASSAGRFIRNAVGNTSVLFPIGTATSYAPLTIKNTGGGANMTTGVQSTLTNAPYNAAGVFNLQWSVLGSAATTSNITFQFNAADFPGGSYTPAAAEVGNYQTFYTTSQLGTPTGSNPYSLAATGLSMPASGTNYYVVGNSGAVVASSITYTWAGGTNGSYTTASNWSPTRNSTATGDILQINPSSPTTITNVPVESISGLSINGSSTVTLAPATTGNTLTIGSTLVVNTGNTLDLGTVQLAGSFVNSGTGTILIGNTSTTPTPTGKTWTSVVSYEGSGSQTVTAGSYNGGLTINNAAGCTLGGSVSIGNGVSFTLTSGVLALSTNNLTLGSTSILTGGSSSSYVNASSTGKFIRNAVGSTALLFPIGTASSYAPLSIKNTGAGSNISANIQSTFTHAPYDNTGVFNLQWLVLSSVATTSTIVFQFNGSDFPSTYTPAAAELGVYQTAYAATNYGTPAGSNPYTLTASGLAVPTSGSNYYVIGNIGKVVNPNYVWNGSVSTDYTVAANWTPVRNSPSTVDVLHVNPASPVSITNVPTETIDQLQIGGSSTATLVPAVATNSLTIATSLTINSGNTLDVGALKLAGTFTPAGTGALLTASTSVTPIPTSKTWTFDVTYDGTTAQTISNGTYNAKLGINNAAGATLKASTTVTGTLVLTNGIITLSTFNLTVSATGSITGGSASSYVYGNSTGVFTRNSVGNTATLFPIGTATSYAPLTITNTTGTSNLTTTVINTFANQPGDTTQVIKLQWSVLGSAVTTATIKYQFNTADFPSAYTVSSSELGTYKTSYTTTDLGTPTGSNPYNATATGLSIPTSGSNYYVIGNTGNIVVTATTWTGAVSTAWATAGNWSNGVPSSNLDVVIASASKSPILAASQSVKNLTINSGAIFTLNTGVTLSPTLNITNNGIISGAGTLVLGSTSPQTYTGTGTVASFTLNNSNGLSIANGNKLNITGVLTLQSGTLTTNGNVVFKSNGIASSGTLAPVNASGNTGSISGTVTVERYIPKGYRSYRDIAPGVYGAGNTIFNTWQENGSYTSGSGMFITGGSKDPNTTNMVNRINLGSGFDSSLSAARTAYTYTAGVWANIPNTYLSLNPYQGYRLMVRGDRSFNLYTTPTDNTPLGFLMYNDTRLRASGTLITGNVAYTTSGVTNSVYNSSYGLNGANDTAYSLVANPYVSPVDWGLLTKGNLSSYYYYLDPTIGTTGTYIACNAAIKPYIQAGQAFFIQNLKGAGTSPTLTFTESAKASSSTHTAVFGNTSKLPIALLREETAGTGSYHKMDEANVVFDKSYSNNYGNEDAPKLANSSDNLALQEGNSRGLSIDSRQPATKDDIITIQLGQVAKAHYQLRIETTSYSSNGLPPYVYDAYTKTYTPLNSAVNTINFAVDNTVAASYANRFSIVFKSTVLAVNSITATATLKDGAATISWNTVGENKVADYTVEKSTDGRTYTNIGTESAKNTATASYSYVDNSINGTTYYRIKATSIDGSTAYSNAVTLTPYALHLTPYTLYPNPLIGKVLNVKLENVAAGKYTVSIYNSLGQKVHSETVSHAGGNATHGLSITEKLANGVYNVAISSASSKQVVYNASITVQ